MQTFSKYKFSKEDNCLNWYYSDHPVREPVQAGATRAVPALQSEVVKPLSKSATPPTHCQLRVWVLSAACFSTLTYVRWPLKPPHCQLSVCKGWILSAPSLSSRCSEQKTQVFKRKCFKVIESHRSTPSCGSSAYSTSSMCSVSPSYLSSSTRDSRLRFKPTLVPTLSFLRCGTE